jgi:hypothetical protein
MAPVIPDLMASMIIFSLETKNIGAIITGNSMFKSEHKAAFSDIG